MIGPKKLIEEDIQTISIDCAGIETELNQVENEVLKRYTKLNTATGKFEAELSTLLTEYGPQETAELTRESVQFQTFVTDGSSAFGDVTCSWIQHIGERNQENSQARPVLFPKNPPFSQDYKEQLQRLHLTYSLNILKHIRGTQNPEDKGLTEINIRALQVKHEQTIERLLGLTVVEDLFGQETKDTALFCISDPKVSTVSIVEADLSKKIRTRHSGVRYQVHAGVVINPKEPTITTIMRHPKVVNSLAGFSERHDANIYLVHHPSARFFVDALGDYVCNKVMRSYTNRRFICTGEISHLVGHRLHEGLSNLLAITNLEDELQDAKSVFNPSIYKQKVLPVELKEEEQAKVINQINTLQERLKEINTEAKNKSDYVNQKTAKYEQEYTKHLNDKWQLFEDGKQPYEGKVRFNCIGTIDLSFDTCVCRHDLGYVWYDDSDSCRMGIPLANWELKNKEIPTELFETEEPGLGKIWVAYVQDVMDHLFDITEGADVSQMGIYQLHSKAEELKEQIELLELGEHATYLKKS